MTKHTPVPWEVNHGKRGTLAMSEDEMAPYTFIQVAHDGNCPRAKICELDTEAIDQRAFSESSRFRTQEEIEANAEFIVRACNSHAALLEALKELERNIGNIEQFQTLRPHQLEFFADNALRVIGAAIAAAGGQPMTVEHWKDGWHVVGVPPYNCDGETVTDYGPYETKAEAEQTRIRADRFTREFRRTVKGKA